MKIVYFSKTGHCKRIADILGDYHCEKPLEIKASKPYPDDLGELSKIAKSEIEEGKNIPIEKMELDGGEDIYLIFPSWHRRLPQAVVSFIRVYKPSKIIAIVSSYEDIGMCDLVLRELSNDFKLANVKEGQENETINILKKKGLLSE